MRKSRAREIILEELRKLKTHPRGDELFQTVRQRLPQVSLGTVYRNLDLMRREGAVRELFCGDFNRYDGNMSPHSHFLCRDCKRLWDFEASGMPEKIEPARGEDDFRVEGYSMLFYGLCHRCLLERHR